ncbi:hypothetical protein QYB63_002951 [Clostridium perfringens]|nr:hypothetical protein [Clostridium perfringens]
MVLDERYKFLNDIELSELEGKEEDFVIYKGIKFNKDERELLKFIKWKGEKFSNYVKYLIEQDMRNTIEGKSNTNNYSITPSIDEEYLEKLIQKVIDKNSETAITKIKEEVINDNPKEEYTMSSLGNLMAGQ